MKTLFNFFNKLKLVNIIIILICLGYSKLIIFGFFIEDDYSVFTLNNININEAIKNVCDWSSNRPLGCIYYSLISRITPVFQVYFVFILVTYIFCLLLTLEIFKNYINHPILKKIYILFSIFPFFSYTTLYSPAMQGVGIFSLLFWILSLFFLKKFIESNKFYNFIFSKFFICVLLLTYESAIPLIGITIFFPLLYLNKKRLFLFNILTYSLILITILYLQKFIFPIFFDQELSRIKISIIDYKKVIFLMSANFILILNIFFQSIEFFILNIFNIIKNFNYFIILQIFFFTIISYSIFNNSIIFKLSSKKSKHFFVFVLMFSLVIILVCAMHAMSNTGLEFYRYNNRALVSLSYLLGLFFPIFLIFINIKHRNLFKYLSLIIIFILFVNFISFQTNLINKKNEYLNLTQLIKSNLFLNNKDLKYKYIVINRYNYSEKWMHYDNWHPYLATETVNNSLFKREPNKIEVINPNKRLYCNPFYRGSKIETKTGDQYFYNIIYIYNNKSYKYLDNLSYINMKKKLSDDFSCGKFDQNSFMSEDRNSRIANDDMFDSVFLIFIKKFYFKYFF